jgi:hypothetical protein
MFNVKATIQGQQFTVVTEQPAERLILETNAELQKMEPMADREGLGRWALSVPMLEMENLRRKYPALRSRDPMERSRAWLKFIASDESKPYRVRATI